MSSSNSAFAILDDEGHLNTFLEQAGIPSIPHAPANFPIAGYASLAPTASLHDAFLELDQAPRSDAQASANGLGHLPVLRGNPRNYITDTVTRFREAAEQRMRGCEPDYSSLQPVLLPVSRLHNLNSQSPAALARNQNQSDSQKSPSAGSEMGTDEREERNESSPLLHTMARTEQPEEQLYFSQWVRPEGRSTPRSQPRTVIITGFPSTATAQMIICLVYHGAVERMRVRGTRAFVTFTAGDDARHYYNATANGVIHNSPGGLVNRFVAMVDISPDIEPVSSRLREQLLEGVTRVVVVKNCPQEYTNMALKRIGEARGELECFVDKGITNGQKEVAFRYFEIERAAQLLLTLRRAEEFAEATIGYGIDPCKAASGPHYD